MKHRKLIILGIDGMDPVVMRSMTGRLPHLEAMQATTGPVTYESIFPPDSIPAWISFFTGKNPAEHGVLQSIDYLSAEAPERVDLSSFKGSTFWDIASDAGRKVAIVNPFLAYPPWPVNGAMISGSFFVDGPPKSHPPEFITAHPPPFIGGYEAAPSEQDLPAFIEDTEKESRDLADYVIALWEREQPDLLFATLLTLDRGQHFLWRFMDTEDPTYPGDNPYAKSIETLYMLIDDFVGRLKQLVGPDVNIMLMSDHGHGRRCTSLINLNEVLRKEGLLVCHGSASPFSKARLLEKCKTWVLHYAHHWHMERLLQKAAKHVPNKKALKRGDHIIDQANSIAYTSDFDGANPFGGICINRANTEDYEGARNRVIDLLTNLHRFGAFDVAPVRWAKRREDIYTGSKLDNYPDVVFELEPQYGVHWSVFAPLVVANPRHRTLSGGHLKEGVLLVSSDAMAGALNDREYPFTLFSHVLHWLGLDETTSA